MKTTLVIMAAGIGSRFGGGIKQLEPVGPNGEIIMDYSIHDAIEAGFDNIIFIIRKDLEKDFKEIIGNRIEKICDVSYAYQELDDLPEGFSKPDARKKPWGTGQALLACKDLITNPFVVINADDYYGKTAFTKVHDYLVSPSKDKDSFSLCLAGFILKNTLSENGGVTRGVCSIDEDFNLTKINETQNIVKTVSGAAVMAKDGTLLPLDANSYVSMNMWGSTPKFLSVLETGFIEFLADLSSDDIKSEYILPTIIDGLIKSGKAKVKLLETKDKWFGVTYKEDKQVVVNAIKQLIATQDELQTKI
ncbi:sugar phosphate nucleotidyltransferase [Youngiibacter multivorans]|uniref:dTDP-glucose pyrophosphorylase n=1 Tax=Youngiibacter multivorans TaxID=937251 RepID=A0ABS4G8H3_9CLOT|nr:sugar phosphate nucleotidyltransferase [Youngiibacter multivorans]MBP1920831.1 dTDP-glucose pyrophosphorylase [Youngiibacter multivorans]